VHELGNAMTYMLSAREQLDLALPRMKRLAADFLEGKDRAFIEWFVGKQEVRAEQRVVQEG
jgi:hypothetical protein